jgi:hypothetical protein
MGIYSFRKRKNNDKLTPLFLFLKTGNYFYNLNYTQYKPKTFYYEKTLTFKIIHPNRCTPDVE